MLLLSAGLDPGAEINIPYMHQARHGWYVGAIVLLIWSLLVLPFQRSDPARVKHMLKIKLMWHDDAWRNAMQRDTTFH